MNLFKDRKYLHDRHRLSHQQIDRLLGESLAKNYLQEKIKAMELVRQLIGLADLLNEHNIPFISFKGPLLSQQIYGDPTVRISHDLDVLVAVEDVDRINQLLLHNGYCYHDRYRWPLKKRQQELFVESVQHISYRHLKTGILLEIHWTILTEIPFSQEKLKTVIANNSRTTEFHGRKINVFTAEINLLYLIMHGAKHGWQRLKWLVDIKDYPTEDIDQHKFNLLVTQFGSQRIIAQTKVLLRYYYNFDQPLFINEHIPSNLLTFVNKNILNPVNENRSIKEVLQDCRYRMRLFKGSNYKYKVINTLLTSPFDIVQITSSYKFIYYLYRPYSFIKRRLIHAK